MSSRLPHPFMLTDLVHRNASAVLFAASQTPAITLEVLPPEKIGGDLYKVRVRLVNGGAMPSLTYTAVQRKIHPQDTLKMAGKTATVVSGGRVSGIGDRGGGLQGSTGPKSSSCRCPATARSSTSSSCRARAR